MVLANSTGRVYAEHNDISLTNEFTAKWTAPAENSGDISFYVSGLGANANGASSGDHAPTPIRLTFSEALTTSTSQIDAAIELDIYPNPTYQDINISGDIRNRTIEIYRFQTLISTVKAKEEQLVLPLDQLETGIYFIVIKNVRNQIVATKKIMKS